MNNSIKLNTGDEQWVKTAGVKLAGEESKDRLYEPKHKKKLVRVLTVVAYVFFVSLAAIMLSLYYVFLWNGNQKDVSKSRQSYEAQHSNGLCSNGENVLVDVPYEPTAIPVVEAKTEAPSPSTPEPIIEETLNEGDWPINISYSQLPELTKRSPMFKKLILSNIMD